MSHKTAECCLEVTFNATQFVRVIRATTEENAICLCAPKSWRSVASAAPDDGLVKTHVSHDFAAFFGLAGFAGCDAPFFIWRNVSYRLPSASNLSE
jgi:hypothetical protein